jgi:ribosomal protein L12E/L44/L45/RPP1/RPP2
LHFGSILKAAVASSTALHPGRATEEEEEEEEKEEEEEEWRPVCEHFGIVFGAHLRGPRGAVSW